MGNSVSDQMEWGCEPMCSPKRHPHGRPLATVKVDELLISEMFGQTTYAVPVLSEPEPVTQEEEWHMMAADQTRKRTDTVGRRRWRETEKHEWQNVLLSERPDNQATLGVGRSHNDYRLLFTKRQIEEGGFEEENGSAAGEEVKDVELGRLFFLGEPDPEQMHPLGEEDDDDDELTKFDLESSDAEGMVKV